MRVAAGLTGSEDCSTSIGDMDGNQDLLITGLYENSNPTATLYLGDGEGEFTEADAGLAGAVISSTSTADIDGDEDPDLLITGLSSASRSESSILYQVRLQSSGMNPSIPGSTGDGVGNLEPDFRTDQQDLVLYENLFNNPLPVEFAGLNATTEGEEVKLTWQTASETNNAGFEVHRRTAGMQAAWKQVGFAKARPLAALHLNHYVISSPILDYPTQPTRCPIV